MIRRLVVGLLCVMGLGVGAWAEAVTLQCPAGMFLIKCGSEGTPSEFLTGDAGIYKVWNGCSGTATVQTARDDPPVVKGAIPTKTQGRVALSNSYLYAVRTDGQVAASPSPGVWYPGVCVARDPGW